MNVLFVASEAYPLIKTGGLADVAGALPAALADLGEDVRLMLPAYPEALDKAKHKGKAVPLGDPLGVGETKLIPARMPDSGLRVWLVDCPALFARDGNPYVGADGHDWPDNHLRFALLARAAALVCVGGAMIGWQPDLVHANDWQTGLVPAYLDQWGGPTTPSVFTIHNMHYQGVFGADAVGPVGLKHDQFALHGVEYHGKLSFLKAGLIYSDRLTTVSPTYAREVRETDLGHGFQGLMGLRSDDTVGILNGVDYTAWNPAKDPRIAAPFDAGNLDGKAANKVALQREQGLDEDPGAPLLAVVSRMAEQKGIDLVLESVDAIVQSGSQLMLVGSGDPALEGWAREAAEKHPGRVAAFVGYDEDLSHRVQAGADIFLVPSRFEPCGLTQLYALRYGTLPLVRRTGGLADSVPDVGETEDGVGFVFDEATGEAFLGALWRALELYNRPKKWRDVQKRAMNLDYSWQRSAEGYRALYDEIT